MPIKTFSYDTGNEPISRITGAIAKDYNYQPLIDGEPNPESEEDYADRMFGQIIIDTVKRQDLRDAQKAAEANVNPITLN